MKCPNCGADLAKGKFCEYCGAQITASMLREQEQINKEGCPICVSTNISFNREKQGEIKGKNRLAVVRSTVGFCKDCGYTWTTGYDQPLKKRKTWLWVLGWIFIFPVPLTILMLRKRDMKPAVKYGIIAAGWIVFLLIGIGNNSGTTHNETATSSTVQESSVTKTVTSTGEPSPSSSNNNKQTATKNGKTADKNVDIDKGADKDIDKDAAVTSSESDGIIRPEIKDAIDSYELFVDQYCDFLESFDASDTKMLMEYLSLLAKAEEMTEKFDAIEEEDLNDAESLYYTDVALRCSQKMLTASGNI